MKQKKKPIMGTSFSSMIEEKETGGNVPSEAGSAAEVETTAAMPEREPVVIDDFEILYSFIEESQDHLETIEEKILKLETSQDSEVVAEIFRSMHTMKGISSFFGFDHIKVLSHSLESLLDDLRSRSIELSRPLVDVLLAGTDVLTRMIAELKTVASAYEGTKGEVTIPPSQIDDTPVLTAIDALRKGVSLQTTMPEQKPPATSPVTLQPQRVSPKAKIGRPTARADSLITDEIRENFVAESHDLLDAAEELILELEKSPENRSPLDGAFRCLHTLKGNAGFLSYASLESECMSLEGVLDELRSHEKRINQNSIGTILSSIDAIRNLLSSGESSPVDDEDEAPPEDAGDEYKPLGSILVEMGATTQEDIDNALDRQERKLGEILVEQGKVSSEAVETALSAQRAAQASSTKQIERKDIRVDMSKLDKLFDLMGELITAEAMVIHNPELAGLNLERFNTATNYLSKITREMQEITMSVRMIPLEGLFNKMRRLVRDLSKRFDKEIDLAVFGQDTEMDRNVIEEIADPLMHIIRNAIDHGVESASRRAEAGKPRTGHIELGARYEGNEIWISIADDGAGLNRERILAKATERGLLKADAETMRDEEVWRLVFEPGFSTAAVVSEVSGRGVGMDVVKRNVEKLRGKIDILSNAGAGTTITLKIPLTLAIIDGITAKAGNVLYALPLSDILEFHKSKASQISRTDSTHEVLRLRDEIIPIVKLVEFFGAEKTIGGTEAGILVITQRNGKKAALLVDDITGYQQIVVKALPEYMGIMRAISGCSILGNGEVSLIIDVGSLLKEEFDG